MQKTQKETEEIRYRMAHYVKVFENDKVAFDEEMSSMKQYIDELERNL